MIWKNEYKVTQEYLVMKIAENSHGIVWTKEVEELGVSSKILSRLEKKRWIKKISKGVYAVSELYDDYFFAYIRCRQGVFSHESALYLHEVVYYNSRRMHISIPSHYNTRIITKGPTFYYLDKELYNLGKVEVETRYGNKVYAYDLERTICDLVLSRKRNHKKVRISYAKHVYRDCKDRINNEKIYEYAQKLNIRKELIDEVIYGVYEENYRRNI